MAGDRFQTQESDDSVNSLSACLFCGGVGVVRHRNLVDRLKGIPGRWDQRWCSSCRLLWLDPMPTPSEVPALYHRYFSEFQTATTWAPSATSKAGSVRHRFGRVWPLKSRRDALRHQSTYYLTGETPGRLLEFGCGNGRRLASIQALGWTDSIGQEVDPVARNAAENRGLTVFGNSIPELELANGSFDVATSWHVIEHMVDPERDLAAILQLLRPGGKLISMLPNSASINAVVFGRYWHQLDPPRHVRLYCPPSITQLLERAGFVDIHVRTSSLNDEGIAALSTQAALRRIPARPRWSIAKVTGIIFQTFATATMSARRGRGEDIEVVAYRPLVVDGCPTSA